MAFGLDSRLFESALQGDSEALNSVVSTLRPHIERQLTRYPVTEEDRHDLLQATLLQVVRRLGSFRGDSSFSTWLFRVTANEALMLMRSQRRHRARLVEGLDFEELAALPAVNDAESTSRSDVNAANEERDARIRTALEELPEDYRRVVVAHYHMDLGLQEIADRFEITESAVRSRLHRARTRLRAILEGTAVAHEAREEARAAEPWQRRGKPLEHAA
jgi:RNA polymerase sigma-70 factor (ECF subfamily)